MLELCSGGFKCNCKKKKTYYYIHDYDLLQWNWILNVCVNIIFYMYMHLLTNIWIKEKISVYKTMHIHAYTIKHCENLSAFPPKPCIVLPTSRSFYIRFCIRKPTVSGVEMIYQIFTEIMNINLLETTSTQVVPTDTRRRFGQYWTSIPSDSTDQGTLNGHGALDFTHHNFTVLMSIFSAHIMTLPNFT